MSDNRAIQIQSLSSIIRFKSTFREIRLEVCRTSGRQSDRSRFWTSRFVDTRLFCLLFRTIHSRCNAAIKIQR